MGSEKRERKKSNQAARRAALETARKKAEQRQRARRFGILAVVVVVGVLGFTFFVSRGNGKSDPKANAGSSTTTTGDGGPTTTGKPLEAIAPVAGGKEIKGDTPCPKADGSEARAAKFEKAPPTCIDPKKKYTAVFDTGAGKVTVALDATNTPGTVNNFVVLARYKFYDGSSFQRTDPSISIIQGGSPATQSISDPGAGYTIKDEPTFTQDAASGGLKGPYKYVDGDLVMARSQGADSSGAQFFFGAGPSVSNLDAQGTYIKFGHVTEGLDVLHKVLASHVDCPVGGGGSCLGGAPQPPVAVTKITITES